MLLHQNSLKPSLRSISHFVVILFKCRAEWSHVEEFKWDLWGTLSPVSQSSTQWVGITAHGRKALFSDYLWQNVRIWLHIGHKYSSLNGFQLNSPFTLTVFDLLFKTFLKFSPHLQSAEDYLLEPHGNHLVSWSGLPVFNQKHRPKHNFWTITM